jgi:hypothetical protein
MTSRESLGPNGAAGNPENHLRIYGALVARMLVS